MRKTVIVTGGAGGIGSAVVKKFHNEGFNVVIGCNSSVSRAEVLATEIIADGGSAIAVSSDLSTADGCKRLIDAAIKRYGRVDVLINNCGKSLYGLFIDNTEETVRSCFDVNVMSAVFCSQYSINDMLKRKCGVIVNVSSMWGITGASMEQLESYIVKGIPILTWITIDLETARVNDSLKWQESNTLKEHIPYTNLHAVVLLGLDGNYAHVMNPLTGYESIPIDVFKQSFESLQSRAIVVY